jgi:hypothetical protein
MAAEVPDFREGGSDSSQSTDNDISSSEENGDPVEDELASEDDSDIDDDDDDDDDASEDDSKDDSEDEEKERNKRTNSKSNPGFLEGGKSATLARAFARTLDSASKNAKQNLLTAELDAPILAASKSLATRKAEEEALSKADRAAKRLKMEMRMRGHVVPSKRGEDPDADAKEKSLQKIATRGVVQLFNAVAKAQRKLREVDDLTHSRAQAAKLGRASFLLELKKAREESSSKHKKKESQESIGKQEKHQPKINKDEVQDELIESEPDMDDEAAEGWQVLRQNFDGLKGKGRMKDWDRPELSDSEEEVNDSAMSDDDDEI